MLFIINLLYLYFIIVKLYILNYNNFGIFINFFIKLIKKNEKKIQ